MFHHYGRDAFEVLFVARQEVSRLGGSSVTPGHLLLGILRRVPACLGPAPDEPDADSRLIESLEATLKEEEKTPASEDVLVSPALSEILQYAEEERVKSEAARMKAGHLVLAILRSHDPAKDLLEKRGVTEAEVRWRVNVPEDNDPNVGRSIG